MTPRRTPDAASLEDLRSDVLVHVGAFLAGKDTAQELDAWLLDATWNVRLQSDPTTRSLTGLLGRYLAEYAKGHRSDEELWHLLLGILAETPALPRLAQRSAAHLAFDVHATETLAPNPAAVSTSLLAAHA